MTHKGGKKAKKAYRKLKSLPKATKEHIEDLSHPQLLALLMFVKALLASSRAGAGRGRRSGAKHKKNGRKLSVGIHRHVKVGKHYRTVRVLGNGRWRFMKG
jgi:hypothetical protein